MERRALLKSLGGMAGLAAASWKLLPAGEPQPKPGVFADQVGYLPGQAKIGTVSNMAGAIDFRVRSTGSSAVLFEGKLAAAVLDPTSGDGTSQANFSSVKAPGTYRLEVPER